MTLPSITSDEFREEIAKVIAETAIGIPLNDLMRDKREWIALQGLKRGHSRDINDPFQSDVREAAHTIQQLVLSRMEIEEALKVGAVWPDGVLDRVEEWVNRKTGGYADVREIATALLAALSTSSPSPQSKTEGEGA